MVSGATICKLAMMSAPADVFGVNVMPTIEVMPVKGSLHGCGVDMCCVDDTTRVSMWATTRGSQLLQQSIVRTEIAVAHQHVC